MGQIWKAFVIDHRSIRLFRIALGFGLIFQCLEYWPQIGDFFTDDGLFPRYFLLANPQLEHLYTPINLMGTWWWAALWVGSLAVFGLLLIYNIKPRLISFMAFFVVLSLLHRAPVIYFGADQVLRFLCFWSIFLPSVKTREDEPNALVTGATAAVVLQICVLYAMAGFSKDPVEWWATGNASYTALQGDMYSTAIGKALSSHVDLLRVSTRIVFLIERFGWILFLIPWKQGWMRMAGVLMMAGMHTMFGMAIHLSLFPFFDITLLTLAVPPQFWNRFQVSRLFEPRVKEEPKWSFEHFWSFWSEPLAMFAWALVLWNCLASLPEKPLMKIGNRLVRWEYLAGVQQSWSMFAPSPYVNDGWYVMRGFTMGKKSVDLLSMTEGPVSFDRPKDVFMRNPSPRWTDYLFPVRYREYADMQKRLGDYLCEKWDRIRPADPMHDVQIWFVHEITKPPGEKMELQNEMIFTEICPGLIESTRLSQGAKSPAPPAEGGRPLSRKPFAKK